MIPSVSWLDGKLYELYNRGLPKDPGFALEDFPWQPSRLGDEARHPTVMVHGFRYNPRAKSTDNPHWCGPLGEGGSFVRWRRDLAPGAIGFGWYSVPFGFWSVLKSWRHGRYNSYRWAYDLAAEASLALAQVILAFERPCNILCHSLGSSVILRAMESDNALPVSNVVFMNGAEASSRAYRVAKACPHTRFVNLIVREDDVLRLLGSVAIPDGRLYSAVIGRNGLCGESLSNWIDVILDNPKVQDWGLLDHGWQLCGDNPDSIGDHWYTYKHKGNHGLIQAALDGKLLSPPSSSS